MSKKKVVSKAEKQMNRKVIIVTFIGLLIVISGGYFINEYMINYSYNSYLEDAEKCINENDYQGAIVKINLAEEFNPRGAKLLELKGDVFRDYNKDERAAVDHYSLAITHYIENKDKGRVLLKKAKLNQDQGNVELAIEDLKTTLELVPTLDSVNFYLAEIYSQSLYDYPNAIQFYERELGYHAESFKVNYGLAFSLYKNKDFEKAINFFTKAAKLDASKGECYYFRGLSYSSQSKDELACEDYLKAIDLNYARAYINYKSLCNEEPIF